MSKIIEKISASLILMLMLFSISFNVISYAATNNGTVTITSTRIKLIVDENFYNNYDSSVWNSWLSRYDGYYSILKSYTGVDPLAENGDDYITIDISNNITGGAEGLTAGRNIRGDKTCFELELSTIFNSSAAESGVMLHEFTHVFQYHNSNYYYDWCFHPEILAGYLAGYLYNNGSMSKVIGTDGTRIYTFNTYEEFRNNNAGGVYDDYYSITTILENVNNQVGGGLSNAIRTIRTGSNKEKSYKFNLLIDTWSEITGVDIWSKFSDNNISKIQEVLGGKIGTLKEPETPTAYVTVNLETNITKNSKTYTIGKDTEIKVTGTLTTNTEIDRVMVNGNSGATITKQPSGYTYSATIKPTETTIGNKQISVAVIKDNNILTTQAVTIELIKEDSSVNLTVNLKTNTTNSSSTYTIGKDTEIKVTGTVTTNTEIDKVMVNGNSVATIIKQQSGYTYEVTIKPTETTVGDKKISVAVIKDNNILATKEETIKLIKEETKATITNVKIVGNNSNTDGELDLSNDNKVILDIEVETNEDIDSIKISLGKKRYSINKGTKNDKKITYSGSIELTEEIKTGLKENSTVTITAVKDEKELDKITKSLTFTSGEVSIGAIQFQQDETKDSKIYDVTGNKTAKISIDVNGIENEKDLTFKTVVLKGFEATETNISVNTSQKIATITMSLKPREGVTLENGKIDGEVILEVKGEQLRGNFTIEIINAEEKESEYPYYYKIGVQEEKQIPEDKQITVHVKEAIFITVKGKNTSDKTLKISNLELNGTYDNGETIYKGFHFLGTGTATAKLGDEEVAKFTIIEEEKKETLYVFNVSGSGIGKQPGEGTVVKVDRDSVNNDGTYGGEANWLIKSENGKSYYCYYKGKNLRFESGTYFYRYNESEEIEVSKKDQLILAYIKNITNEEASKISGITLSGEDWKEHLIQYYIWNNLAEGNSSANYGQLQSFINKITAFTSEKNEYINIKEGTITLNGKTYSIKNFSASKYIVNAKYYSSTGDPKWANYTDSDMQPLFTFEVEIEEGETPGIYLEKIDGKTTEKLISEFTVSKYNEGENKYVLFPDAIVTKKDGRVKIEGISLTEKAKYIIKETKAPEGYNITTQYIILEISPEKEDIVTMTVYTANNTETTGIAKPNPSSDKEVKDSKIWELDSSETTEKGEIIYKVIVKNYPNIPQIKKIDEITNAALQGAIFTAYIEKDGKLVSTGITTKATDDKGYANLSEMFEKTECYTEKDDTKQIILRETSAPNGYNKTDAVYIITMDKDGKLTGKYYETANNWKNNKEEKELTIENETGAVVIKNKTGTPTLELEKVDSAGNAIKEKGGKFQITLKANGETIYDEKQSLNPEGKIVVELTEEQISKIVSNQAEKKRIPVEVTVKEIEAPDGYAKGEQDTFTFTTYYYEETGWETPINVQGNGIFTAAKQGALISMTLKNETDTPRIEINKTDDKGNKIDGTVVFTVYSDEKCTNSVGTITITNGETTTLQLPEVKANSTVTYYLKETTTPVGYQGLNKTIKLVIKIDENGKVKEVTSDGEKVTISGNLITLTVENKPIEVNKLKLKIKKVDGTSDSPLSNVSFDITGDVKPGDTTTSNGIITRDYIEVEKGKEYKVTITETSTLKGYELLETPIIITVYINLDGTIEEPKIESINNSGVSLSTETESDGTLVIIVKIKNYKKIKTELEVPLLMHINGTVWLDGISGKSSDTNDMLGDSVDKNLSGILVELYESDGSTPAEVAQSEDVRKAIDEILIYQGEMEAVETEDVDLTGTPNKYANMDPRARKELEQKNQLALDTAIKDLLTFCEKATSYGRSILGINFVENKTYRGMLESLFNAMEMDFEKEYNKIPPTTELEKESYKEDTLKDMFVSLMNKVIDAYKDKLELEGYSKVDSENDSSKSNQPYEEILNEKSKKLLEDDYTELKNLQDNGIINTTVTDSNGNFKFYGLNPSKTYVVRFTYNGMRYQSVNCTYTIGSNISGDQLVKTSKAIENEAERKNLTDMFKEIRTYPYNYYSPKLNKYNIAYTQDEVEETVKTEKYGNYIINLRNKTDNMTSIEAFIRDTEITATIEGLGNIIQKAEETVKANNAKVDEKTNEMVYPVVGIKNITDGAERISLSDGCERRKTYNNSL